MFKRSLRFVGRKAAIWLGIGALAGLWMGALEVGLSLTLALLLNVLGISSEVPSLPFGLTFERAPVFVVGSALIIIGVARGVMQLLINHSGSVAREVISLRLRLLSIYQTLRLKQGFISLSEINLRVTEIFPRAAIFCEQAAIFVPWAVQALLMMTVLFWTFPRETAVGVSGVGVIAALVHLMNVNVRKFASRVPVEYFQFQRLLTRVVRNWFLIQALRTTKEEHDRLVHHLLHLSGNSIRSSLFLFGAAVMPQVLGVLLIVALIAFHVASPRHSGLEFVAFLYIYLRFVQSLASMATAFGHMNNNWAQFKTAFDFFRGFDRETIGMALSPLDQITSTGKKEPNARALAEQSAPASLPVDGNGRHAPSIEVEDLSFRYASGSSKVFENLSFQLPAGQSLAIVGRSGAGKSTLLALVLGLLEPTSGRVTIEGAIPSDFLKTRHGDLGYVGAEPFLIEGTIRENLLYGHPNGAPVPAERLWKALEQARLAEWVGSLQERMEYRIGESGDGLSMGQKQRLAIARALLRNPSLLILDEVSANLDEATESEIAQVIQGLQGSCTTLVVSHREGLISGVSRRISL